MNVLVEVIELQRRQALAHWRQQYGMNTALGKGGTPVPRQNTKECQIRATDHQC